MPWRGGAFVCPRIDPRCRRWPSVDRDNEEAHSVISLGASGLPPTPCRLAELAPQVSAFD